MRGKRHKDEIREKALALLMSGESVSGTAKALGLSRSSVRNWVIKDKEGRGNAAAGGKSSQKLEKACADESKKVNNSVISDTELEKVRQERKKNFIENSWKIIEDVQAVIARRVERAAYKETLLDEIMKMAEENEHLTDEERNAIVRKISGIRLDDVRALSSILATLYDKQALAVGDPTLNIDGKVGFEDL